jgi:hypothetical protein
MLIGFITHWLSYEFKERWKNRFIESHFLIQAAICIAVIFIIYQSVSSELQPFIYFQF